MDAQTITRMIELHTRAIDSRNGYLEAMTKDGGQGMSSLFAEMSALHTTNASELAAALEKSGETADENGSFMTTVNEAIMDVRSLFGGLGPSVLSGLIDGEGRNAKAYSEALAESISPEATAILQRQLAKINRKITAMRKTQDALEHMAR